MAYRYRQIGEIRHPSGTCKRSGVTFVGNPYSIRLLLRTEDDNNPSIREKPYSSDIIYSNIVPMSGTIRLRSSQVTIAELSAYLWDYASEIPALFEPPGRAADSYYVAQVLSGSNPSRSKVDVPTFIGELRDAPRMFRDIFGSMSRIVRSSSYRKFSTKQRLQHAAKQAALEVFPQGDKWFISNQFGWEPLISDVESYFSLANSVDSRSRELQNLKAFGNSSRRVKLNETSTSSTNPSMTLDTSVGTTLKGQRIYTGLYRQWGSGRWSLDSNGRLARTRDISDIQRLARSALLGMTVDASTAWNLTPWSWLIDWASNAGDWIESSRNIIGASPTGRVCIMTERKSTLQQNNVAPASSAVLYEGNSGSCTMVRHSRKRTTHSPVNIPAFHMPILTGRQSAILASLATMRAKGSSTYVARF